LLQVESISVSYGDVQVLYNVTVEVKKGEIVTLLGSNGAGKTTTLKAISGLMRAKSGKLTYGVLDLQTIPAYQLVSRGIVMVPEGRRLFPNMTVYENLLMGAYHREARPGINGNMDRVTEMFPKIKERLRQMAGTLSGGEQQMLAIGRALMSNPKLLMLDEPSLGLAPNLVEQIFETIKDINRKQDVTVLLVEQNANMALQIANRGYVMENGKIVLSGNSKDLLNNDQVRKVYLGL